MVRKISLSMQWLWVLVFILSGFGSFSIGIRAYAASPQDIVTVPAGDPIQIALVTFLNANIPYQDYYDAFDMAVGDYGMIKGFSIQRNDFDAGCDQEAGEIAGYQVITNTQNLGVVGPLCSSSTLGMAPVLESAGVVMISYSNTNPDLGNNGWTVFNRTVVVDPEYQYWNELISDLPNVIAWSNAFNVIYGRPPSEFTKYVYDATSLLLTRINEVSTLDVDNNLLVDRAALASAVRNTSAFEGITSLITLESDGDRQFKFIDNIILPAGEPIQLALTTWITGTVPYQDYYDAFDMAVDDYGPIKGFSIQRNDYNAGCDPVAGEAAGVQVITNTQNLGVIGPYCTASTRGMAPKLESAGVVMISYSNTGPDLGGKGWTMFNRTVVVDPGYNAWNAIISNLSTVSTWSDNFNANFGRPPSEFAKYVYDSTTLMLTRIDEVSTLDGSSNLVLDRSALSLAVRNTSSYLGITGEITLEADGDRVNLFTFTFLPLIKK
jgi:ABC-type branched-subunit amino acid transport system substrate-binding protein